MKKTKLFNLTILSTILLFSACSDSQDKLQANTTNKNVSIYSIMGITEPTKEDFSSNSNNTQAMISPNITYVSYKKKPSNFYYFNQKKQQLINEIEVRAKSFLGVPYVWGATGPNTFDCSGFTQWVYRDVGINIPRVSKNQARVGQFVKYQNLQRGDMVFFDTKKKRTGLVSHVGIYLGNGDFIHASSAGKSVVIYNFNEKEFYKKRFLWGRRVTDSRLQFASN